MIQLSCLNTRCSVPAHKCVNGTQAAWYQSREGTQLSVQGFGLKSEFFHSISSWRDHGKREDGRPRGLLIVFHSRQDLIGKNIVVVGLGASGRAAVKLALARGAHVVAVDAKSNVDLPEVDAALASRLRIELGPHQKETFHEASQLVLSPGVSAAQSDVASAIRAGVPAISELSFAAEALPKGTKIAAVSGTNGKSTVTTFAGQMLLHAGVRVFVGGNLGTPLSEAALKCLACPAEDPPFHAAVVEVSSYQMELPGTFCPKVAAILNLSPDHLERHKTMESYGLTKCRLFAQMDASNLAVIPQGDAFLQKLALQSAHRGTRAWLGGLPGVQAVWALAKLEGEGRRAFVTVPTTGAQAGLHLSGLKAVGSHNAHNTGSAALLALALDVGLDEDGIQDAIPNLSVLPHRMELVHQDEKGVSWVNDSKATNVDATFVGMKGITGQKAVVLIGGLAKAGGGFDRLVGVLSSHRAVVLFGASGKQIESELRDGGIAVPCVRTDFMKDAVDIARTFVKSGDMVILSPACASFDEFRNFECRGQIFTDLAKLTVS